MLHYYDHHMRICVGTLSYSAFGSQNTSFTKLAGVFCHGKTLQPEKKDVQCAILLVNLDLVYNLAAAE